MDRAHILYHCQLSLAVLSLLTIPVLAEANSGCEYPTLDAYVLPNLLTPVIGFTL